jgi:hypothetical protein
MDRIKVGGLLLVVLQVLSHAADLARINQIVRQREERILNLRYLYSDSYSYRSYSDIQIKDMLTKRTSWSVQLMVEILRSNEMTRFRYYPAQAPTRQSRLGQQVQVSSISAHFPVTEWTWWFGSDWMALLEYGFGNSEQDIRKILWVAPCPGQGLYYHSLPHSDLRNILPFERILLANGNLLKAMDTQWNTVQFTGGRWHLKGRYAGRFAEGWVALVLQADGLPLQLTVRQYRTFTDRRSGVVRKRLMEELEWRTEEVVRIEGIPIPKRISYRRKNYFLNDEFTSRIVLIKVEPFGGKVEMRLPIGTRVWDARLASYEKMFKEMVNPEEVREAISYDWQGRLPSKEELHRLAYQQGYLLPPESPRHRYSLWLFAPAVLFFTAAAYLYWKQKRR